jgi:HSP20 family protein
MRLTRYQPADLWNWSSLDQLTSSREEINRFFEPGVMGGSQFNLWSPILDVFEDKENVIVKVELPGMKREDIDIALHDGMLSISGERKHEAKSGEGESYRLERYQGRFQRTVALPKPVSSEHVKAAYQDGILTVTLPKTEEAKPRQIQVS